MIIKVKYKADFDRFTAEWGLLHFKENEKAFELYLFKFGVGYLYVVEKGKLRDVNAFRDLLKGTYYAIEIEEIKEDGDINKKTTEETEEEKPREEKIAEVI